MECAQLWALQTARPGGRVRVDKSFDLEVAPVGPQPEVPARAPGRAIFSADRSAHSKPGRNRIHAQNAYSYTRVSGMIRLQCLR